jgi:hypothetical protein
MSDKRVYLKVKVKSLAAEALIIRKEEKKNTKVDPELGCNPIRMGLKDHRKGVVRWEARHALLAYGFIRGRAYRQIEPSGSGSFDVDKVWRMIEKYSEKNADQKELFNIWKELGKSEGSQVVKAEGCNPSNAGSNPASRSMFGKTRQFLGL